MPRRDYALWLYAPRGHAFWKDAIRGTFSNMPFDWMPQRDYALWLHASRGNAFWQDAKIQASLFVDKLLETLTWCYAHLHSKGLVWQDKLTILVYLVCNRLRISQYLDTKQNKIIHDSEIHKIALKPYIWRGKVGSKTNKKTEKPSMIISFLCMLTLISLFFTIF